MEANDEANSLHHKVVRLKPVKIAIKAFLFMKAFINFDVILGKFFIKLLPSLFVAVPREALAKLLIIIYKI